MTGRCGRRHREYHIEVLGNLPTDIVERVSQMHGVALRCGRCRIKDARANILSRGRLDKSDVQKQLAKENDGHQDLKR